MVILDFDSLNRRELTVDLEKGDDNLIDEGSNDSSKENINLPDDYSSKDKESPDMKNKKKKWYKKPPKPPRPSHDPSMNAADQKFVQELSELALLKRARVERMKALKRMKNARLTNSRSNYIAFVITVAFCLVILWQELIRMVRTAFMKFFWKGRIDVKYHAPTAFKHIEKPVRKGGLGRINMSIWNKAAFLKHVDNFFNARNNMWVEWSVNHVVKDKDFWSMKEPQKISWTWRSIFRMKAIFLPHFRFKIFPQSSINLWTDPWLRNGMILNNVLTNLEIDVTGISKNAKGLWPKRGSVSNFRSFPESFKRARGGSISVQLNKNHSKNSASIAASLKNRLKNYSACIYTYAPYN